MEKRLRTFQVIQQSGLIIVILLLGIALTVLTPTHIDLRSGHEVNNFLNPDSLMHVATQTAFFAIMAVGITTVVISGGIDLSIGSVVALAGVVVIISVIAHGVSAAPLAARYDRAAADLAWGRTLEFLRQQLGTGSGGGR